MTVSFSWAPVVSNWYTNITAAITAVSPGPDDLLAVSSTIGCGEYGYLQLADEVIWYSEVVDSTHFRIGQRGAEGPVATAHQQGTVIGATLVPAHLNELQAAVLELQQKVGL